MASSETPPGVCTKHPFFDITSSYPTWRVPGRDGPPSAPCSGRDRGTKGPWEQGDEAAASRKWRPPDWPSAPGAWVMDYRTRPLSLTCAGDWPCLGAYR